MNAEWVTALSTLGTFVVIAASALAALLQLRHMRSANQVAAYNECRETMDTKEFRDALAFIRAELPKRLEDAELVDQIAKVGLHAEYSGVRTVANLFESMGLFVKAGMMEERIACELWSGIVLTVWETLRPLTARIRRTAPGIWINFEYMALLSTRYIKNFPDGEYPAGTERMPLP